MGIVSCFAPYFAHCIKAGNGNVLLGFTEGSGRGREGGGVGRGGEGWQEGERESWMREAAYYKAPLRTHDLSTLPHLLHHLEPCNT
jgi:hypothetical protein